jgi:hypothetical protein
MSRPNFHDRRVWTPARLAIPTAPAQYTNVNRALLTLLLLIGTAVRAADVKTRVIVARDESAVDGLQVDPGKVRALARTGLLALTGATNKTAAWQTLVSSNDIVGIKISTLGAPLLVTHRAVVDALAAGLADVGVAPANIIVFDRDPRKMRDGDWTPSPVSATQPYRVVSIIGDTGWDPKAIYESKLVGKLIWGDLDFSRQEGLGTRSHLPALVTHLLTKLINVPVLMDHDPCGIAGCLYNISINMVDNTRRFEQFGQHCDPAIEEIIAQSPALRQTLTLNVMDGLIAGYAGGPSFKMQYSTPYGGLFFSRDPVAVDAVCLDILETNRKAGKVVAIGTSASHVANATLLGLGQSDLKKITVTEVKP